MLTCLQVIRTRKKAFRNQDSKLRGNVFILMQEKNIKQNKKQVQECGFILLIMFQNTVVGKCHQKLQKQSYSTPA